MAVKWHDKEFEGLLSELDDRPGSFREFVAEHPLASATVAFKITLAVVKCGLITGDAAFYLIANAVLGLTEGRDAVAGSPVLASLGNRLMAVEKQRGLKGAESWPQGEGPQEWNDLQIDWNHAFEKLVIAKFMEFDEPGMAHIYANNRYEFNRRCENGRRLVFQRRQDAA